MTEERATFLTELIDNRISHRKSEEKYFGDKYEKLFPFDQRDCSVREYSERFTKARNTHMAEYDKRIATAGLF